MLVSGQNGRPLPEKRGTPNRLRIRHLNRASKTDPKRMPDFELRFWLIFSVEIGTPFRPQIGHPKRITKLSAPNRPQCCDVRTDPENVENWTGTRRQRFWGAIFGGATRDSRQPKTNNTNLDLHHPRPPCVPTLAPQQRTCCGAEVGTQVGTHPLFFSVIAKAKKLYAQNGSGLPEIILPESVHQSVHTP